MNELITNAEKLTMSSREIAELVNSRHDSVKRTIERLVEKGIIDQPPTVDGEKSANQVVEKIYLFTGEQGKRDSYVVVAQLSPEFTAKLVDRWQELEAQQSPQLAIPQDYSSALRLAADLHDKNQTLEAENQQKAEIIEAQRPSVEFVERFVDGSKLYSITEASKVLSFKRKDFIDCLIRDKYLYRIGGVLVPYETPKCKKLFNVKTGCSEWGRNFTQTKITAEGLNKFSDIYSSELLEVA